MTRAASGSCMTSPASWRADRDGCPSSSTDPSCSAALLESSSPASAASSVDLPAPDGPSSRTRSPGSMRRSTPRSAQARRPACRQPQPRTSTATGGAGGGRSLVGTRVGEPGGQTRAWSRPDANGARTPVFASARTSNQAPEAGDDQRAGRQQQGVAQLPPAGPGGVVERQVEQRGRNTGDSPCGEGCRQLPRAVEQEREDQLRRRALDQPVEHDLQAPRGAEERRDDRRDQLGVDRAAPACG